MTDKYEWPRLISSTVRSKIKGKIESHIRCHGPSREPLLIRIDTYASNTCFKAQVQCQCNDKAHAFLLKREIPI